MKTRPMRCTTFAERVLGIMLTRGQYVLARVVFDGVEPCDLPPADRELARELFGDVDQVQPLARVVLCLLLGRNSGKTMLAVIFCLWRMYTGDLSACGPGDLPHVVIVCPTKRTASHDVRVALGLVRGSSELRGCIKSESADGFVLRRPSDGRLVAFASFPASRGGHAARGLSIVSAVLDEAMFFLSESEYAVNDRGVFGGLIPRLMSGGKIVFLSTLWPVPTLMGELHEKNFGAPQTALAALAPTILMRDGDETIATVIAFERERDPELAALEFDCKGAHTSGSGLLLDPEAITQCVDDGLILPQPAPHNATVCFGADLGFSSDSSALVGAALVSGVVELLTITERRPSKGKPLSPKAVVEDFAETIGSYGGRGFMADGHYKLTAKEHLETNGLTFHDAPTGRDGKAETYLHLRKLVHEERVRLPPHARLLAQMRIVVARKVEGGGTQIILPRRQGLAHGDILSATVLACWQASKARRAGRDPSPVFHAISPIADSYMAHPDGGAFYGGGSAGF